MKYKELIEAHGLTLHGDIEHFAELVEAQEREECAKVCEMQDGAGVTNEYWWQCAEAIRARGTT